MSTSLVLHPVHRLAHLEGPHAYAPVGFSIPNCFVIEAVLEMRDVRGNSVSTDFSFSNGTGKERKRDHQRRPFMWLQAGVIGAIDVQINDRDLCTKGALAYIRALPQETPIIIDEYTG